jgi:hypothetical protein
VFKRLVAAAAVLGVVAAGARAQASPAVAITSMRPVTVAGRGFVPGERVRVVVYAKQTQVRTAVASKRGRFLVRFPMAVGQCTSIRVAAKGNHGSRASYAIALTCEPSPG